MKMNKMRWIRGNDYVELEAGLDVDKGAVVFVSSNRSFSELPVEFRDSVPQGDRVKVGALRSAVERWAQENGFNSEREA